MNIPTTQAALWDAAAETKTFSHPLPVSTLKNNLSPRDRILDYGCGYGRSCQALFSAGFEKYFGIDISSKLIRRGVEQYPDINVVQFDGSSLPFPRESFEACLLVAVLNCIPSISDQKKTVREIHRILKPGGLLFLSDYPLQKDRRNQERYQKFAGEYQDFGVFRTADGGVFRHHEMDHVRSLFVDFEFLEQKKIQVKTMNGNPAEIFQIAAKKNKGTHD